MLSLHDYDESPRLKITNDTLRASDDTASLAIKPLRSKSLLFATFPWSTVLPTIETKLVEQLGDHRDDYPGFVGHLFLNSRDDINKLYVFFL
jgi:hypothetical protein